MLNDLKGGTFCAKALYLRRLIPGPPTPEELSQPGHDLLQEGPPD